MNDLVGITERGDAALDMGWMPWVSDGHPAILITKNPGILGALLARRETNVIVHATITGWGGTALEPQVVKPEAALEGFAALVSQLGPERVVLRVDPVVPTPRGIDTAISVLHHATADTRVRVSFLDLYEHVRVRLLRGDVDIGGPFWRGLHAPLEVRRRAWDALGRPEVCGEPGFVSQGCLSDRDCRVLGVTPVEFSGGQRSACTCLAQKAELLGSRSPCAHGCLYCYWKGE